MTATAAPTLSQPLVSVDESFSVPSATPNLRQQVMVLYLGTSSLDSSVIGWTRYDGTGRSKPTMGDSDQPPYGTGVEALLDGWRLIQMSQLLPHDKGNEYDVSYLPYEFLFEKLVDIS